MTKIGTFEVHGSEQIGFTIRDTCTFNRWSNDAHVWPTREEAEEYAQRCHDFKIGRRMYV